MTASKAPSSVSANGVSVRTAVARFDFALGGPYMMLSREARYADVERHRAASRSTTD